MRQSRFLVSGKSKLLVGLLLALLWQSGLACFGQGQLAEAAPTLEAGSVFFAETGHNLSGGFKKYWDGHGGLAQFGYPITEPFSEMNTDDKKTYTTQYFQRARFELHPENTGTESEVLLGLLGRLVATKVPVIPKESTPLGSTYFEATGHSLSGAFLNYWQNHGGLAIYGYPLTEPTQEKNLDDGKTYSVQYFERNRFELHPENAGTPNEVLLGLLGTQIARQRGLLAAPPEPLPTAVTTLAALSFDIRGTAFEQTIHSPILNKNEPYRIYLPPGYNASGKRYPVLYMLHGYSGVDNEWTDYHLFEIADQLITTGKLGPMIIVLPTGEQEYWVDHANGGLQWGAYVAKDVVGYIDATYRTIPDHDHRAIGGHSMGGHGSLQIAINYPSVFGIVGAHSPTFRTKKQAPDYFGDEAYFEAHDPVSLAQSSQAVFNLKIWVDIGNQDTGWLPRAQEFHDALASRNVPHQWHILPGDHSALNYWTPNLPQYLQFYSISFGSGAVAS